MNNYEYIIAGLPLLQSEGSRTTAAAAGLDADAVLEDIRGQLSAKDNALVDCLLDGWKEENLNADFYRSALKHRNAFIRGYFAFDLELRNAKVRYLNRELGRPEGTDIVSLAREDEEPEEEDRSLDAIFEAKDLLSREKQQDDAVWKKVDEMIIMNLFDIDVVLAFIVKLHIVNRWLKLDENTGREMFRILVDEVLGTFKGLNYNPDNK